MRTIAFVVPAVLVCLASSAAHAQNSTRFMITGNGSSNSQQSSSEALEQADQQARDNATANCVNILTGDPGQPENVHINYHATFKQRDGLFGATSQAVGMCKVTVQRDTSETAAIRAPFSTLRHR